MLRSLYILFGTIKPFSGLSLPQAGAVFYNHRCPEIDVIKKARLTVRISFGLIDFDIP